MANATAHRTKGVEVAGNRTEQVRAWLTEAGGFGVMLLVIDLTARHSYLLFHMLAELFSIFIAFTVFVIVLNNWQLVRNQYLLFIGIACLFVASLDLLHTLSYKGMPIFSDYDYYAPQFWIAARYMEATAMLLGFAFLGSNHRVSVAPIFVAFALTTVGLAASILYFKSFPVCFVAGQGLTAFKVVSEYAICGLLLASLRLLHTKRQRFDTRVYRLIQCSLILMIATELCFTLYESDSMADFLNEFGHLLKVGAFFLTYKAVVVTALQDPVRLLFGELEDSERESRRREEALRESERLLSDVINGSPSPIFLKDRAGQFLTINAALERMLGMSREQIKGKTDYDIAPKESADNWRKHDLKVLETREPLQIEELADLLDGRHVFLAHKFALVDAAGQAYGVGAISHDITEHKLAEEELRANEQRLRLANEATGVGIWEWNLNTNKILWDEQMFRIYGIDPTDDGYVDYSDWSTAVHSDDLQHQEQILRDTAQRCGHNAREFRIHRTSDGELRFIEAKETVRKNKKGEVEWVIGTNLDCTERRIEEDALKVAKDTAERANNSKSRFLAAASHDLRQPLSALSMYASLLEHTRSPSEQKVVAAMKDCIGSLSRLLTDLLDLSKLEAGVVTPSLRDFPITEMLDCLDSANRPEAELKGLKLRCRPSRLTVRSDPVLLQRVLGNLIDNAICYTQQGGVLVACRRRQGKTWVEVWDTGIGIPAHQITEIFEDFRQLGDQARNSGSGLGLAIVAKTAALLGLEIKVRSRSGRGSVFAVELPLGHSDSATAAPAPAQPAMGHPALRIALVDDNPMVRSALEAGLQSLGHQVAAADCRATLLAELGTLTPDIVVSDYRLAQGETGFDVITALRTQWGNDLPSILITGDTDPNVVRSMTERGIVVLHKPIELETLQKCVEDLTCQRQAVFSSGARGDRRE